MLSLVVAAACLIGSVFAQLPPSYTLASTNTTLGVKYGSVNVIPGETLSYKVPSKAPTLTSPHPLNGTYIAIAVDTTANLSAPIPASLLWFQQDLTFSPTTGIATTTTINSTAQVPYLAPSNVGHAYLVLIYAQPLGFVIPANFPYNAGFRKGFNVTRVAVDFQTPLVEANWFLLGGNCEEVVGAGGGGGGSGGGGFSPTGTGGGFSTATRGTSSTATAAAGEHGGKGAYKRAAAGLRLRG